MKKCHIVKSRNIPFFLFDVCLVLVEIYHFHYLEFQLCFVQKSNKFFIKMVSSTILIVKSDKDISTCENFPYSHEHQMVVLD